MCKKILGNEVCFNPRLSGITLQKYYDFETHRPKKKMNDKKAGQVPSSLPKAASTLSDTKLFLPLLCSKMASLRKNRKGK